jgi:trigger factor
VSQRLLEKIVPPSCRRVYEEHDLKPVSDPELLDVDFDDQVHFEAKVDVQPEFEVSPEDYTNIPVEKEDREVSDEDVKEQIDKYLKNKTKMIPVEEQRPVREGDFVRVDMEGFSEEGESIPGTAENDIIMEIGSERYLPEIEQGLVGSEAGEEKTIKATFPDDFIDDNLAGEEVEFNVSVKEIQTENRPSLEDEEILEELDVESADEFREKLHEQLLKMVEQNDKQEVSSQIYDYLVENIEFDIPSSLVEREAESIIDNQRNQIESQGMDFEDWLAQQERSLDELKEEVKPEAERRIKLTLIFESIGREEEIEADDSDVEEHIEEMAANYGLEADEFKEHLPPQMMGSIRQQKRDEKILDYLIEKADINLLEPEDTQE